MREYVNPLNDVAIALHAFVQHVPELNEHIRTMMQEVSVSRIKRDRIVMSGGIDPMLIGTVFINTQRSDVALRKVDGS